MPFLVDPHRFQRARQKSKPPLLDAGAPELGQEVVQSAFGCSGTLEPRYLVDVGRENKLFLSSFFLRS